MSSPFKPLADLKTQDLPEKKLPNWKLMGPGAILVGLSIGAGEIIIWPRIAADYGSTMIWAAVIGVFLQMWINLEVGRWTIATGETAYTGHVRVWRGFCIVFILLNGSELAGAGVGAGVRAGAQGDTRRTRLALGRQRSSSRHLGHQDFLDGCDFFRRGGRPVWAEADL